MIFLVVLFKDENIESDEQETEFKWHIRAQVFFNKYSK